jgi:hypothetical protein
LLKIKNIISNSSGTLFVTPEIIFRHESVDKFWGDAEGYRYVAYKSNDSLLNLVKEAVESGLHIVVLDNELEKETKKLIKQVTSNYTFIPYKEGQEQEAHELLNIKSTATDFVLSQEANLLCINQCKAYLSAEYKEGLKAYIEKAQKRIGSEITTETIDAFIGENKFSKVSEFSLVIPNKVENVFESSSKQIDQGMGSTFDNKENTLIYKKWNNEKPSLETWILDRNIKDEIPDNNDEESTLNTMFRLNNAISLIEEKIPALKAEPLEQEAYTLLGLYLIKRNLAVTAELGMWSESYFLNMKGQDFATFYIINNGTNDFIADLLFHFYVQGSKTALYSSIVNRELGQCSQYLSILNQAAIYARNDTNKLLFHIQRSELYSLFDLKNFSKVELESAKSYEDTIELSRLEKNVTKYLLGFSKEVLSFDDEEKYDSVIGQICSNSLHKEDIKLKELAEFAYQQNKNTSFKYFNDTSLWSSSFSFTKLEKIFTSGTTIFQFGKKAADSTEKDKWYNGKFSYKGISITLFALGSDGDVYIKIRSNLKNNSNKLMSLFKGYLGQEINIQISDNKNVILIASLKVKANGSASGTGKALILDIPDISKLNFEIIK